MASLIEKYKLKRIAALMASEEGQDWNELTDMEKDRYYAKAYQKDNDKKMTRPPKK